MIEKMKKLLALAFVVMAVLPVSAQTNKVLIAYFSWAHNAQPLDRDFDAITGASLIVPGTTGKIAEIIRNRVNAPVHIITVDHKYPNNYDDCVSEGNRERNANVRHKLTSHVANMDDYDVIFLGFPNWWYGLPMPVYSFLEGYDFSGKTIIPFVTHGTGGLAGTIRELTAALPRDCKISKAFNIYHRNVNSAVNSAQTSVNTWLAELGY
jgi:flavodoxin